MTLNKLITTKYIDTKICFASWFLELPTINVTKNMIKENTQDRTYQHQYIHKHQLYLEDMHQHHHVQQSFHFIPNERQNPHESMV